MTMIKRVMIAGVAAAVLATSFVSVEAMPLVTGAAVSDRTGGLVQNVQYNGDEYQYYRDRERRREFEERRYGDRQFGDRGPGYYNGYRGYRERRPGYRRGNDGFWYPLAAFAAGAIIGGAIASPPRQPAPSNGINPRHYRWCQERYGAAYDRYSNTVIRPSGRETQCLSPYY